ncbi:MAG: hypothetical protein KBD00_03050 [Candidatus Peribacteraceae bacterium]|nr:hypothetical protein [Candidatus Peribacteraceae bacterium]
MHTTKRFHDLALVTVIALGSLLLKAIFFAVTPIRNLALTSWIIDDTYIIMNISRNIAIGKGFSYDWIHSTSGAPPFWTYLMSINHMIFPKMMAIKMTFIESGFFGMLAAVTIFLIAKKVTDDRRIAWTAFLLSLFSGNAFFEAVNGMDTSLFTFLVIVSVATFVGVGRPKNWSAFRWGGVVGACAGLAALVRGDGIFIIGALGAFQLLSIAMHTGPERKKHIQALSGFILWAIILFAILIGWQVMRTGTPFLANQIGRRELSLSLHNFSFDHFSLTHYVRIVIWNVFQLEKLVNVATASSALAFVGILFGFAKKELRPLASITTLYIVSFFGMLIAYQWYFPDLHGLRYINPGVHLLFIFVAALLWSLPFASAKLTKIAAVLATVYLLILSWVSFRDLVNNIAWTKGMSFTGQLTEQELTDGWQGIDWIKANLPADAIIGVRDHGLVALFSERPIQDIAGNIDPNVPYHVRQGGLAEYLQSRNVSYLLIPTLEQRKDALYKTLHTTLPLSKVAGAPPSRNATLYHIDWDKLTPAK